MGIGTEVSWGSLSLLMTRQTIIVAVGWRKYSSNPKINPSPPISPAMAEVFTHLQPSSAGMLQPVHLHSTQTDTPSPGGNQLEPGVMTWPTSWSSQTFWRWCSLRYPSTFHARLGVYGWASFFPEHRHTESMRMPGHGFENFMPGSNCSTLTLSRYQSILRLTL